MKALVNGRVVLPNGVVYGKALLFDKQIIGVVPEAEIPHDVERIDAAGAYVAPGLIDIHSHGYLGEDTSDGKYEGLVTMAEGVAKNGVTAFLPTTMTVSYDALRTAYEQIR
ncbi:MAG: N-acetylglucosamine-6-phosphate deacetylase, partial [Clostridia bacterium]|nr:N-acetylglucosamine-6-phosphate deacetylase [Clostridia bacterium]